jgi:hypothetical protein
MGAIRGWVRLSRCASCGGGRQVGGCVKAVQPSAATVHRKEYVTFLKVAYLPNGSFVLPIISRLTGSTKADVRALAEKWRKSPTALLGASLSTKTTMLGLVAGRLYGKVLPLTSELGQTEDLSELVRDGYAWMPTQKLLPYELLLEVDGFIFEFRSCYEILGKFLKAFSLDILGKQIVEQDLIALLAAQGIDNSWAKTLQEQRKLWFHEHAPWMAYRIKNIDPLDADPVFLANIDTDPSDTTATVSLSTLSRIYSGFSRALQEFQDWALREIGALEASATS